MNTKLRANNLAVTVSAISNLEPTPDVMAHAGDMISTRAREEYSLNIKIMLGLTAPPYVLVFGSGLAFHPTPNVC